jgi:hypothetical protein
LDDPRADRVHADIRSRVIERRRLGQADDAEFRGAVSSLTGEAFDAGSRGGVHDHAAPLHQHQGDLVSHAKEHAPEVDADDPVPLLLLEIGCRRERLFDARIVEGEVEAPESPDRLLQGGPYIVILRHIAPDGERVASCLFDHARRFLAAVFRNVGNHDTGSLAGESQRGSSSDAVGSPGYERNLSCEACIVRRHHPLLSA